MKIKTSKKLLRIITGMLTFIPLARGGAEIICGAELFNNGVAVDPVLGSEFRFLAGLFFVTGLIFAWLTPQMGNAKVTPIVTVVGLSYTFGALMRFIVIFQTGLLPWFWMVGIVVEVFMIPILVLWQINLGRKSAIADARNEV